jgi:hypothetical protein
MRASMASALVLMLVLTAAGDGQPRRLTLLSFDGRGRPVINMNAGPNGTEGWVFWRVCHPQTRCVKPRASRVFAHGRVLRPGAEPAGTTFVGRVLYHGEIRYKETSRWRGQVRANRRPRVRGIAQVGAWVAAEPARWSGGWGVERHDLRLEACRRRYGRCHTVAAPLYVGPSRVQLSPDLAGWYLHAADVHIAPDAGDSAIGYLLPTAVPVTRRSAVVSWSRPIRIRAASAAMRTGPTHASSK